MAMAPRDSSRNGPGKLCRLLTCDHAALAALLKLAFGCRRRIDRPAYALFHGDFLKHIEVEERFFLPILRVKRGKLRIVKKLHGDHKALAALLRLRPTRAVGAALRDMLARHMKLEEGPGGIYQALQELTVDDADALLAELLGSSKLRERAYRSGEKSSKGVTQPVAKIAAAPKLISPRKRGTEPVRFL